MTSNDYTCLQEREGNIALFRRNSQDNDLEPRLSSVPFRSAEKFEDWPPQEADTSPPLSADITGYSEGHQDVDIFHPGGPTRNTTVSVIAPNAHWHGTLQSTGAVQVFGEVDGERIIAVDLLIAAGARVSASISATNLTVAGIVTGAISCANRFEVLSSGEVHGEVISPAIIVHEGARVIGMMSNSELNQDVENAEAES